jgi:hypothetical protein
MEMDFETVHRNLRTMTPDEMERYVQQLLANRFDRKVRSFLCHGMDNKELVPIVLQICSNIFYTRDENMVKFVSLVPEILPTAIQLLTDYAHGHLAATVVGNLASYSPICIQMVIKYGLMDRLEVVADNPLSYESPLEIHLYTCQTVFNISSGPLMLDNGFRDQVYGILHSLIPHASDTEAYVYLLWSFKKLPLYPSELITRLSKQLNKMRSLISLVDKDIESL